MTKLPIVLKKYESIPLMAIPQETMNSLELDLKRFVGKILNLDEKNREQLELCIPVLLDRCRRSNFKEVAIMLTDYVDGKLGIEPRSNYIDRILIGKIINANKLHGRQKEKPMENKKLNVEQKEFIMLEAVDRIRHQWKQHRKLDGYTHHIYDYLFEKKELVISNERKREINKSAISLFDGVHIENITPEYLAKFNKTTSNENKEKVKKISKRLALQEFLQKDLDNKRSKNKN